MAEEIGFENGRNSNFQGLVTSTYIPNFIQYKSNKLFVDGRTYGHTDVRTDGHFPRLILLGRLLEVDLKTEMFYWSFTSLVLFGLHQFLILATPML